MQGITFELDDDMVADDDEREALQDIINNSKLSESYLTLARDIEVMEPKSPEDIYKVWILYLLHIFNVVDKIWCCINSGVAGFLPFSFPMVVCGVLKC